MEAPLSAPSRPLTPALAALALHLNVRHSPLCRHFSEQHSQLQTVSWLRRYVCNCGLVDRLEKALSDQIREDVRNGIKRNLER